MKILVVTISDRAYSGEYQDLSGPAVKAILEDGIPGAEVETVVVPDEAPEIEKALDSGLGSDVVVTTGGTGLGPRDVTPEVTARFCDRGVPGISEMLRAESMRETPNAPLSRGWSGMKGKTLVVNIPGSVRGASFCAKILAKLLPHAVSMMDSGGHPGH